MYLQQGTDVSSTEDIPGLEIAPVWVAFATKSFAFATRNCQLVEVLRPTFDGPGH